MSFDDKNKIKRRPNLWFVIGIGLLLAAGGSIGWNLYEQNNAKSASESLLALAEQKLEAQQAQPSQPQELPTASGEESTSWDLYNLDGILSIPSLGLRLPVLSDYSEDLLKVSVCVYEKDGEGQPPRMILAGHNYPAHFGKLSSLQPGDSVGYEPIEGESISYQVVEVTEIAADDREALESGEWDMTLLTCNWDMSRRVLARLACLEP